jgi:hypothetical protein
MKSEKFRSGIFRSGIDTIISPTLKILCKYLRASLRLRGECVEYQRWNLNLLPVTCPNRRLHFGLPLRNASVSHYLAPWRGLIVFARRFHRRLRMIPPLRGLKFIMSPLVRLNI